MTDRQLEAYDEETKISSDPFGLFSRDNRNHRKKQELILEHTVAERGDSVLEVGCGHGLHTRAYADSFDLDAVDISPRLVEETRQVAPDATVKVADAHDLPYDDSQFDAVVGTAIFHHMHDQPGALNEWQRVTKDGGTITLMEPNFLFPKDTLTTYLVTEERHKIGMAPWRLRDTLEQACIGRYRVESHTFTPPWPSAFEPLYDSIDAVARRIPVVRAFSQMKLIHIQC